jgi:RecJ-like exonuclease
MQGDVCPICAGDGRIDGAWGRTTVCPACNGTGRRPEYEELIRNPTKTSGRRYAQTNKPVAEKQTWPSTSEGKQLATEVRDCPTCPEETKTRLIQQIIEYEGSHGRCTKTFTKKLRRQLRVTESR